VVERRLAKANVASSNLVFRSKSKQADMACFVISKMDIIILE
jgi:hypothetical protein